MFISIIATGPSSAWRMAIKILFTPTFEVPLASRDSRKLKPNLHDQMSILMLLFLSPDLFHIYLFWK